MKKSLFALAAVGAFAGAAQAQSSVTVYGIMDVGIVGGNQKLGAGTTSGSTNLNGNATRITTNGNESTSRLGFRGTEDLGGGTSAFFTVEVGLAGDTTTVLSSTRLAFAGLSQKGIGQIAFGTQNTTIHNAVGLTDPGQQNNVVGSAIYPVTTSNQPYGTTSAVNFGNTDAYTVRTSNQVSLRSANIAGFTANAMAVMNGQTLTQTAAYSNTGGSAATNGITQYTGWGVGLNYTWQKLLVTANYQSLKSENPYSTATTATGAPAPAAWTGTNGGVNTQDNQAYVAAVYDFGILKAYANWVNRKATSALNSNNYIQRSAQQLGVRGFATKTIEYWGSVGNGKWQEFGTGEPTANFTAYQVGSNYWLSKRTNMYAIFGSNQTSSTTNGAFSQNQYAVGVRHTF